MTHSIPEKMSYIGRKSCGCIAATIEDNPAHKREIADTLRDWILIGWTVERVTTEYVLENWPDECPHQARRLSPEEEMALRASWPSTASQNQVDD